MRDNGTENVNEIMKETLSSLNIKHVTTSPYHPQNNAKVERFHRSLADILAKLADRENENWDLYLTQALAAVRFSICEITKFSLYYMLFERDVVLSVDNLLRPRRKYVGEDHYRLVIEQQHKIFVQTQRRIKRAQKRRNSIVNKSHQEVKFDVGDPVYYRKHFRHGKLDSWWKPYYRIVEQTGLVTFIIWDQLSGKVKRAHANDLKLVELRSWETSTIKNSGRPIRQSTLASLPLNQESVLEDSESELSPIKFAEIYHHSEENPCSLQQDLEEWDPEDTIPLAELKSHDERPPPREEDEENIPLCRIQSRLREKGKPKENTT